MPLVMVGMHDASITRSRCTPLTRHMSQNVSVVTKADRYTKTVWKLGRRYMVSRGLQASEGGPILGGGGHQVTTRVARDGETRRASQRHTSRITRHASHVTHHTSRITRHAAPARANRVEYGSSSTRNCLFKRLTPLPLPPCPNARDNLQGSITAAGVGAMLMCVYTRVLLMMLRCIYYAACVYTSACISGATAYTTAAAGAYGFSAAAAMMRRVMTMLSRATFNV